MYSFSYWNDAHSWRCLREIFLTAFKSVSSVPSANSIHRFEIIFASEPNNIHESLHVMALVISHQEHRCTMTSRLLLFSFYISTKYRPWKNHDCSSSRLIASWVSKSNAPSSVCINFSCSLYQPSMIVKRIQLRTNGWHKVLEVSFVCNFFHPQSVDIAPLPYHPPPPTLFTPHHISIIPSLYSWT